MKIYLAVILLFAVSVSSAQTFDSDKVFSDFIKSRTMANDPEREISKCNFSLANMAAANFDKFSDIQKSLLKPFLERPVLSNSLVTPSGKFRIHYDIGTTNSPSYNLDSLAAAMDSVYRFEVLYLGFGMPPSDNGAGGDNLYDIYIVDMNYYGETLFESIGGKNTSFIKMDNDFRGFYTTGINAAKVTLAHEFHHAIQLGNYSFRESDRWFYELTSTSMEEFVYPEVNDYLNYIRNYFNRPDRSIARNNVGAGDGYDIAIWNIFLERIFDIHIIKRQWDLMPSRPAIEAIQTSIAERDSMFTSVLNQFGVWCFFSGQRALPGKFFPEANRYPTLITRMNQDYAPPSRKYNITAYQASNTFLKIAYVQTNDVDTLVSIISNGDIDDFRADTVHEFSYEVFSSSAPGTRNIGDKFHVKFTPPRPSFWINSEILNNIPAGTGSYLTEKFDFVYPSPFKYGLNTYIYIPVESNISGESDLNIYTAGMDLVYSSSKRIEKPYGQPVVRWNGRNLNNEKLASGVYIYVTQSGDTVKKGKLVIFNE